MRAANIVRSGAWPDRNRHAPSACVSHARISTRSVFVFGQTRKCLETPIGE